MTATAHSARAATAAVFLVNGALFATWASRIPAVKDKLAMGTGVLGLCLLGIALGAVLAKQVSGALVARFGPGRVTQAGILLNCFLLPLAAFAGSVAELGLALFLLGMAMGLCDVAMNAHGIAVQRLQGRSQMSLFHGLYSVGGILAALAGGFAAGAGISVQGHFLAAAAVLAVGAAAASTMLLKADEAGTAETAVPQGEPHRAVMPRLFLLGFIVFCGMMGEGASADWSALYLTENLHAAPAISSWGYAAFAVAMASSRLFSDRLINLFGGLRLVMWSTTAAGAGFAVALLVHHPAAAIAGFAALGFGLAAVVPVFFTVAAQQEGASTGRAITVVSSIGGMGFLAGPPALGYLAEFIGLPAALGTVSLLAFAVAVAARYLGQERQPATTMSLHG